MNYIKGSTFVEPKAKDKFKEVSDNCWYVYQYLILSHLEGRKARNAGNHKP